MLKLLKLELRQQQQHLRWLVFLALIRSDAIITVTTLNNATKYMTTTTNSKNKKRQRLHRIQFVQATNL